MTRKTTRNTKITVRLSQQEALMLQAACDINVSDFVRDAIKHYMAWLDAHRPKKLRQKNTFIPRKQVIDDAREAVPEV